MSNKRILILFFYTILIQIGSAQIIDRAKFSIGEAIEMRSELLDESRDINIYLPNNYDKDSLKKYPVIYLLDGSSDEDFIHISGLVQFCSFSWINILPESIVVGIGNVDRKRDFTFHSNSELDKREFPGSGKSAIFIDFIADELMSMIEDNYRVSEETTIIGQSLGGLFATEILFKRPALFDNYIIISPSLWWDNESLLEQELDQSMKDKSVYVGVGKEGAIMERLAQSLFYKLTLQKHEEIRLFFGFFEGQSHGDVLHLAVYDAFEKLFKQDEGNN